MATSGRPLPCAEEDCPIPRPLPVLFDSLCVVDPRFVRLETLSEAVRRLPRAERDGALGKEGDAERRAALHLVQMRSGEKR